MSVPTSQPQLQGSGNAQAATTFGLALHRDPLANACISALDSKGQPGSGLKVLRLVSKQVKKAMHRAIKGYRVVIDGVTGQRPISPPTLFGHSSPKDRPDDNYIDKLYQTKLLRLRIMVKASETTNRLGFGHVRQMQQFIRTAGPALHSVKTLELELNQDVHHPSSGVCDEEIAGVLSPLAGLCPLVTTLVVTGDVGAMLLEEFADACSGLTSLQTIDMPAYLLEELGEHLPKITSTSIKLFGRYYRQSDRPAFYDQAISVCPFLCKLDVGKHWLPAETWRALPPCLTELCMGAQTLPGDSEAVFAAEDPVEDLESKLPYGLHLPNLKSVGFNTEHMPLCLLASLLRSAPRLSKIAVHDVFVPCSADQIPDLVLLHDRLSTGALAACSNGRRCDEKEGGQGEGLLLFLSTAQTDAGGEQIAAAFLSGLPVFNHFLRLRLAGEEKPPLAQLTRVFPALTMLVTHLSCTWLTKACLPSLVALPDLRILQIESTAIYFSPLEMGLLCARLPALQHLTLGMWCEDCDTLMEAMLTWGRRVVVKSTMG